MRLLISPTKSGIERRDFDPKMFLATIGEGRKAVAFRNKQIIFAQGDAADAVFYIQQGKVRLTVVSTNGKEATLGILGEGEFFGEGGLAGQPLHMGSATAMTDCELLRIDKKASLLYETQSPPLLPLRSLSGASVTTRGSGAVLRISHQPSVTRLV